MTIKGMPRRWVAIVTRLRGSMTRTRDVWASRSPYEEAHTDEGDSSAPVEMYERVLAGTLGKGGAGV